MAAFSLLETNRFGCALETLAQFNLFGEMGGQNLDGDNSVHAGIAGAINFANPASANTREDFVRAETFARENRHELLLTWNGREYNAVRHLQDCVFWGNAAACHAI